MTYKLLKFITAIIYKQFTKFVEEVAMSDEAAKKYRHKSSRDAYDEVIK